MTPTIYLRIRGWAIAMALLWGTLTVDAQSLEAEARPNIVLVYADDMGLDLVSAFNEELGFQTPSIDTLVEEGVSFTNAHSSSSVCSPSRYTLLTGRYHWRTRLKSGIVGVWERPLIKSDRLTLPESLRRQGYHTAMVGKWHLGWEWPGQSEETARRPDRINFYGRIRGGPIAHGFSHYFGCDVVNWPPYGWWLDERIFTDLSGHVEDARHIRAGPADRDWDFHRALPKLVDHARLFIYKQAEQKTPFFLYFSLTSPHNPIVPSAPYEGKTGKGAFADFVVETDAAVGAVLEALSQTGQRRETLVIFTADNGTSLLYSKPEKMRERNVHVTPHWRGGKGSIYEGGTRVPLVFNWPEGFPHPRRLELPVSQADIYATLTELTRYSRSTEEGVDSHNLVPFLTGKRDKWSKTRYVITQDGGGGKYAIRNSRWKLVCHTSDSGETSYELYNLRKNPQETKDLFETHGALVQKLRAALRERIEKGRSTPGPNMKNHAGEIWWPTLPWDQPRP